MTQSEKYNRIAEVCGDPHIAIALSGDERSQWTGVKLFQNWLKQSMCMAYLEFLEDVTASPEERVDAFIRVLNRKK